MITYDELLADWRGTMARVGSDLGVAWPHAFADVAPKVEEFLDAGERHHSVPSRKHGNGEQSLPKLVVRMYEECLRITRDQVGWDQLYLLAEEFEGAVNLYGPAMEDVTGRRLAAEKRVDDLESEVGRLHEIEHRFSERFDTFDRTLATHLAVLDGVASQLSTFHAVVDEIGAQQRTLIRKQEEETNLANASIASLGNAVRQRDEAVRQRDEVIDIMLSSRSWRITAPLRALRKGFMGQSIRGYAGGKAKGVYRALPISQDGKLVLKDMVFRSLSPFLKNTKSYKAWRAFRAHRGLPEYGVSSTSETRMVASDGSEKYLKDIFRRAHASDESEYVPICESPLRYEQIDTRVIAFYLPQFHPIPENDAWWGRGFTEWTNVSKAVPQYVGHYQPRLPGELGFYDLRLVDVMRRQVELAQLYGVQGFCFHYYWFGGQRLLERPLEQFVAAKDIDFPFCVCWANENWTRRWDGQDSEVLMAQNHSPEDDIDFIRELAPLLQDKRYIRVGGKPLVIMYRPSILPNAGATLERWREYCREAGIGELFICMVQFDIEDPRIFGFDAAIEFPPHKLASGLEPINETLHVLNPDYSGYIIDYRSVMNRARDYVANGFNVIRGVFPSWDNEARKPGRGYTFAHASPRRYGEWLRFAIDYARKHPVQGERLVFVNAWNEWAEGAYLEPDRKHGYAYLQATRDALTIKGGVSEKKRVVVVTHDAHPHGAQYLALHMVRELHEVFGFHVDIVILGEGVLEERFALYGKVHKLVGVDHRGSQAKALAWELAQQAQHAIANTTASGLFAQTLNEAGLDVVSLVHELPGVIKRLGLQPHVKAMVSSVRKIIFPAETVRDGFRLFADVNEQQTLLKPQGLFTRSRYRGRINRAEPRRHLRDRLGISLDAKVVLAVGYADHRKGFDLFVDAGLRILDQMPDAHFVWVGHFDAALEASARRDIAKFGREDHFHFPGIDFDTDDYYAGADAYALTSREDPFPSVVLESLSVGTPVVAFAGTGGSEEILSKGCGVLVDRIDAGAFADALLDVLNQSELASSLGQTGRELVQQEYSFRSYMFDILDEVGLPQPKISVVVPNYNYARYLPIRLGSIDAQSVPIYELIVLDDASRDESLEVLDTLRSSFRSDYKVVRNETNSGSVFRQWIKGIELAKGDFVWVAEADDVADPEFLAATLRPMLIDPEVVMAFTQSKQLDENGRVLADNYLEYCRDIDATIWSTSYIERGDEEVRRALSIKNTIPNVSAVLFRREAVARALRESLDEILDFKIAGDWVTYLRILANGKIAFCADSHNEHRRHSQSVTLGSNQLPHLLEVLRVQKMARDEYGPNSTQRACAQKYAQHVYEHLGLATEEAPSVEMCVAARPWLEA
jgi:glycosyltransferase involved in cell wall biosynthesis/GT2 family glycosyltransferase